MLVELETKFLPFAEYKLTLIGSYLDGSPALALVKDGEVCLHLTVYVPEQPLEDGYVYIKTYSENEGILDALINKKIIKKPKELILYNFVTLFKCKLSAKVMDSLGL